MDQMPVFVRIDEPKDLKVLIDDLVSTISEIEKTMQNIHAMSEEESSKISEWKDNFERIMSKVDSINSILPEPERV